MAAPGDWNEISIGTDRTLYVDPNGNAVFVDSENVHVTANAEIVFEHQLPDQASSQAKANRAMTAFNQGKTPTEVLRDHGPQGGGGA